MLLDLLSDLFADLHDTKVLWQIGVVVFCALLSAGLSRIFRRRFPANPQRTGVKKLGVETFSRVVLPFSLWLFLYVGKEILSKWQHVHLLSLLIPIFGSLALIRFGLYLSRRIFARSGDVGAFLLLFEKAFSAIVWFGAIVYYTGFMADVVEYLEETTLSLGHSKLSILSILQALVSVVVTVILALWASASLEERLMKMSGMHSSMRVVLSRVGRSLLILLAILVSLSLVGIDLTVLSVFGGALGVGLGFGLQKIASNYVSGFIILLDRSLSIGDVISVDKYTGKVSQINTRYTVLKGLDGAESVIPNEMLVSSPVQNFSLTDRAVWMSTDVSVAYSTDLPALLPKLVEAVRQVPRVSSVSEPSANMVAFGLSGLDLRIGFWIIDPENGKLGVLSQVNLSIWKLLQELNVEVPYPQSVVTLKTPLPE